MFMLLFYVFLALYFIIRGGTEAGFWSGSALVQGFFMLAAGVSLLIAQLPL